MRLKRIKNVIKNSNEAKNLASNFISLSFLQIAGYIFPLLTVPYLANVIGVEKYGEIAFAMAIMIYFQTLVDYGFVFSAVRDIARCRSDRTMVSQIYSRVMWSRFVLCGIAFLLLTCLILLIPKFWEIKDVLYASFLMVIGHTLFPDWMFQALEKMKYITIFNVLVKLIFTIAIFIFIHSPKDYLLQPVFTSFGYCISGVGSMWLIHRWKYYFGRPRFKDIKEAIKNNFDLFINQIVPNLYNSASIILLGFFHGAVANGVFDAANKFNMAGSSLFSIISRTFYPFLSRRSDKHSFFVRLNLMTASIIAISLFVLAPFIIHSFFPENFDEAIPILRIISISLVFLAMSNVYGTNYLILNGYERVLRRITLYSSLTGFFLAIPAVYFMSYIGVALTIAFARGLIGIGCMIKVIKLKRNY